MKEKIRIASVKVIVFVSALVLVMSMCLFDSDMDLTIPMLVSVFFLGLFTYSNFYWRKENAND